MAKNPSRSKDGLGSLSISELQAEINRRSKGVNKLIKKREKYVALLAELEKQIAAAGGVAGRRGGRRANGAGLKESIAKVLTGKPMNVTDIAEAVLKSGYISSSPNFKVMVNQQLIANKKLFKRVDRGLYAAV